MLHDVYESGDAPLIIVARDAALPAHCKPGEWRKKGTVRVASDIERQVRENGFVAYDSPGVPFDPNGILGGGLRG
jgi:hypothetical protein